MDFKTYLIEALETLKDSNKVKYILKPFSRGDGRSTYLLKIPESEYDKIKHNFKKIDDKNAVLNKEYSSNGYAWKLHSHKQEIFDVNSDSDKGSIWYRIWGVSGDYTFGGAPTFYKIKYSGNKKAAYEVFNKFINEYLK